MERLEKKPEIVTNGYHDVAMAIDVWNYICGNISPGDSLTETFHPRRFTSEVTAHTIEKIYFLATQIRKTNWNRWDIVRESIQLDYEVACSNLVSVVERGVYMLVVALERLRGNQYTHNEQIVRLWTAASANQAQHMAHD